MDTNINLVRKKDESLLQKERTLFIARVGAVISVTFIFCFAVVLFLLSRDPTLPDLQAQQNHAVSTLSLLHPKTATNLLVQDRVKRINQILNVRSSFDQTVNDFQQQIPPELDLDTFSLTQTTVTVSVTSSSLQAIGKFIDNLTQMVKDKKILKSVTIDGIIADEKSGIYSLSISGTLL
ncbi:MAG: hypothetical protein ACREGI_02120 [Candidatus Levyibacteriota bacterium]